MRCLKWEEFATLYDHYYHKVGNLLQHFNPCGMTSDNCKNNFFCCEGCEHLSTTGCTVRSLYCRLWLCPEAESTTDGRLVTKLRSMTWECRDLGLLLYRGSKLETFEYHHK